MSPTVTTARGVAQIFAARLGVGPRIPRKQLRAFKRELRAAGYRKAERRAIAAAKGEATPVSANGLFDG